MNFDRRLGWLAILLLMNSPWSIHAVSSEKAIKIPKDKKLCVLTVRVAYNGSNDVVETLAQCDDDEAIVLNSDKTGSGDDVKRDTRLLSSQTKLFMDEGYKLLNCQTSSPVPGMRYLSRYTCFLTR